MSQLSLKIHEENSPLLETCSCCLCGSSEYFVHEEFPPFKLVKCKCGLYYLNPRLTEEEIYKYYASDSYYISEGLGYENYFSQESSLRATFRCLLRNLKRKKLTGTSLLEVGCGYGYLLDEAKHFFGNRSGTDFCINAIESAKNFAEKVYLGGVESIPSDALFDCIILNQVIEHVYDPLTLIKKLRSHLKRNGSLVLATPNINSPLRFLMKKRWPSYKTPEHVVYYNNKTLKSLLQKAGFQTVDSLPYPHAFPISLIASKFQLSLPKKIGVKHLWIPTTTVAAFGK